MSTLEPTTLQSERLPEASQVQTPRVFISYRRDDSAADTGRLYDALAARFGRESVFMDIDAIPPGADFAQVIQESVSACQVLIAVIGRKWLGAADAAGRPRLTDAQDFVRLEIQAALQQNLRVIPVLVQGATMPPADLLPDSLGNLSGRNALEISYGRWHYDAARLIATLEESGRQSGAGVSNLPVQLTSFVGREPEIAAVEQQLDVFHGLGVPLWRGQALHARPQAALDVELQARPWMVAAQIDRAAWDQEVPVNEIHQAISEARRKIWAEIKTAVAL